MDIGLLKCPDCHEAWIYSNGEERGNYKIVCKCKGSFMFSRWFKSKDDAVRVWNMKVENRIFLEKE